MALISAMATSTIIASVTMFLCIRFGPQLLAKMSARPWGGHPRRPLALEMDDAPEDDPLIELRRLVEEARNRENQTTKPVIW